MEAEAPTVWVDATPTELTAPQLPISYSQMPFLPHPSQSVLAWDRHRIMLAYYPVSKWVEVNYTYQTYMHLQLWEIAISSSTQNEIKPMQKNYFRNLKRELTMKDCLCSLYMSVCLSHRSIARKQQRFAAALPQPGAGVTKYFDPEINWLPQGVTACKGTAVTSRHASLSKYYPRRLEWQNINTNNTAWQSSNELSWISWEQPDYSAIYLDHSTGNHYDCAQSLISI